MANENFSQLNPATAPTGTEIVPLMQGGVTLRSTVNAFTGHASGNSVLGTMLLPTNVAVTDTAAMLAAYSLAISNPLVDPTGGSFGGYAVINLGAGIFNINAAYSMMAGLTGPSQKLSGLKFKGQGSGVTWVKYSPTTSGPLCCNRWIGNVQFEGISFWGTDPNSDFYQSSEQGGTSNIQACGFVDCTWQGSWQNIALFSGGNNNSENRWDRCTVDEQSGTIANWIYIPAAVTCTITSGNPVLAMTNVQGGFANGQCCNFATTVGNIAAATNYFIVAATATGIQVSTTAGGTAITPSANGTSVATNASDQFLNFWFTKCKFWDAKGPWINASFGGQFMIDDCDVSSNGPTANTYIFNLLGQPNANGVQQFRANGLRIEHATDFSLLMNSNWNAGNISFTNLDQSPLVLSRTATDQMCNFNFVNQAGPIISFRDCQLSGQHNYNVNANNFNYQNVAIYEGCTCLQWDCWANFVTVSGSANSGGWPKAKFRNTRTLSNAGTVGYQEIMDTDLYWQNASGIYTEVKTAQLVGASSNFPTSSGSIWFRLPLNAVPLQFRFYKISGPNTGAFQYALQQGKSSPVTIAGGASTPMAGSNAGLAIPLYIVNFAAASSTLLACTTDDSRTFGITDQAGRSGLYNGMLALLDYLG
jgi:hypothetical protein